MNINKLIEKYRSVYIYSKTSTGKTTTILNELKHNNYNYNYSCLQKIKNEKDFLKLLINQNILKMFQKVKNSKKIIVIDNIDYLNNCDKKIINIIVKFLKNKDNKEKYNNIVFLFIGINNNDKKVLELMNNVDYIYNFNVNKTIDHDKNTKEIVKQFLKKENFNYNILNEKTIVSLCYHENIIYYINNDLEKYKRFLDLFSKGDYYDRLSFQKQLWQFNEMTFYLKVLVNFIESEKSSINKEIIFTKILTKYSNEYSNLNFLNNICNRLNIQKEEIYNIFIKKENDELYKKIKKNITNIEERRIIKLLS